MSERITGTVKWFSDVKGYGFIEVGDDIPDVFVHFSGISVDPKHRGVRRSLQDGDQVEFEIGDSGGKRAAVNVTKLKTAAA